MARLLIVSRSMALAMRLADQHDVTELPLGQLDDLVTGPDTDILVLDVGDPVLAVKTVNKLREADLNLPVLLVSGYQPEWEQVETQRVEGVHVVPLPITRVALLHGITVLLEQIPPPAPAWVAVEPPDWPSAGAFEPAVLTATGPDLAIDLRDDVTPGAPAPDQPGPDETAPDQLTANELTPDQLTADELTADEPGPDETARPEITLGDLAPDEVAPEGVELSPSGVTGLSHSTSITRPFDQEPNTGQLPIATPGPATGPHRWLHSSSGSAPTPSTGMPRHGNPNGASASRRIRLGGRSRKPQRDARTGLATDSPGPATDPFGVPAGIFPATALERRLDAEAATGDREGPEGPGGSPGTADLVRLLHERIGQLYGVSDTAQVLADDVIERADADAAAVLVPDGPVWRVSGGVGLRPLERRLVLDGSDWLITEIGSAGRAVLIEDTDIIRQQLSGAPLAAWRHLLAVPVPDVRAIVVLARGEEGGAFTDRDLAAVIVPVREAAGLLAQALAVRRLARILGPLSELDGELPVHPDLEI